MLIECLIKRDGSTSLTLDKYDYVFKPRPELTDGDQGANVCHVNSTYHVDRLLSSGNFREYRKEKKGEVAAPLSDVLTKETFNTVKNAPTLKSLIKKCGDRNLLYVLLEEEKGSAKPREWAGQAIADRLDELEAK